MRAWGDASGCYPARAGSATRLGLHRDWTERPIPARPEGSGRSIRCRAIESASASTSRPRGPPPPRICRAIRPIKRHALRSVASPAQRPRSFASIATIRPSARNCQRGWCLRKNRSFACRTTTRIRGEIARFWSGRRWTTSTPASYSTLRPQPARRAAERDLLVVEEEVFIHPADRVHDRTIDQQARPREPRGRAGPARSPVASPRPREHLPREPAHQPDLGPDRRLRRAVRVLQGEPHDPRRPLAARFVVLDPLHHAREEIAFDHHVGVKEQEPRRARAAPTGVHPGGEPSVVRALDQGQAKAPAKLRRGRVVGSIVHDHDLAPAGADLGRFGEPSGESRRVGPAVVVDDHDRQPGSLARSRGHGGGLRHGGGPYSDLGRASRPSFAE